MERGRGRRGGPYGGRGERGGRSGRGGRGRGGRGGGMPETAEQGAEATRRALHGLSLSVTASPRLDPEKLALAKRPDRGGQAGRPIRVLANFFQMKIGIDKAYHYDIDIKAVEDRVAGTSVYRKLSIYMIEPDWVFRAIVNACAIQNRWPEGWVHDGKKNLFCASEAFPREQRTYQVQLDGDKTFEVAMKWAATIEMTNVRRFLERGDISIPRDAIQCLEICLRFSMSNNPVCHITGRSYFFNDPRTNFELPGGVDLWTGYHQGVKLTQLGLCMNIETTIGAFIRQQPVMKVLEDSVGRRVQEFRHMDRGMWQAMNKAVTGLLIRTIHRGDSTKKQRCRGLTESPATQTMFSLRDGRSLSVAAYWVDKYGPLQYDWMPCLDVSKGKKINYLPIEVCEVVPGQRVQKMTEEHTRGMIRQSARPPQERMDQIQHSITRLNIGTDVPSRAFRLQLNNRMVETQARILPQPHLQYGVPESFNTGEQGSWNLEDVVFYRPGTIQSWSIVSFISKQMSLHSRENSLLPFIQALIDMLRKMGMQVPDGIPPLVHRETSPTSAVLQDGLQEAEKQYGKKPDIMLVLLERRESEPYQEVKRLAERDLGQTTQCFVARSAGIGSPAKNRLQYLANLGMKINHKVGGVNTQIMTTLGRAFPVLGGGKNKPFIVFGADVTHPTGFDSNEPSVGAIVASMDPYLGQFATRVLAMEPREEKMSMAEALVDLFRQFYALNKVTPEAIFFYRDGISEGQFETILAHEYNEIRKACHILSPQYNPPITLTVVQKMHHTRLFPMSGEGDRNGNVKPGTCVDTGITSNYEFDFYLNSHSGIQGTNRPAHYYVLVDENGFGSDGMQLFSYWMCYLYCRCTRSVSYVPPAYYAHLAALHGRYLLAHLTDSSSEGSNGQKRTTIFHEDLNRKMFFV